MRTCQAICVLQDMRGGADPRSPGLGLVPRVDLELVDGLSLEGLEDIYLKQLIWHPPKPHCDPGLQDGGVSRFRQVSELVILASTDSPGYEPSLVLKFLLYQADWTSKSMKNQEINPFILQGHLENLLCVRHCKYKVDQDIWSLGVSRRNHLRIK